MTDAFRAGDEVADLTFDPAPVGVVTGTDGGTGWPLVAWADTRILVEVVDPARLLRTRPPGERGEPSDPALMAGSVEAVTDGTEPRPQLTDELLTEWDVLATAASPAPWVPVTDNCDCYGGCSHGENGGSEFAYAIRTPTHEKWGIGDGSSDVCNPGETGDDLHHQRSEISQFSIADIEFITAARDAVPALIAEVRASRAQEAALRDQLTDEHVIIPDLRKQLDFVEADRDELQQRIDKALAWLPAPGVAGDADAIRAALSGDAS